MAQTQGQHTISWEAPEFRHYSKNYAWYVTAIAICILVIGFFAIERDFFAAISLTIMAVLVLLFTRLTPQITIIELGPRGIFFGNILFPYKQIKHFWIVHTENHKTLNLNTTAMLNNIVILELEDQDPEKIRQYLIKHIPEHEETDPTVPQKIMHRLKF